MMSDTTSELKIKSRTLRLMKPFTNVKYDGKTVLSNSVFEYVELWLSGKGGIKYEDSLFYWRQARDFYKATKILPIQSAPLTAYYCIMNATKALLSVHGLKLVNISHGVSSPRGNNIGDIRKDEIIYDGGGVLCELSKILGESTNKETYKVINLFYNIACIHRTFTITFGKMTDLFIPVDDLVFVKVNDRSNKAYIRFRIDNKYCSSGVLKNINNAFEKTTGPVRNRVYYRSKRRFGWNIHTRQSERLKELSKFHTRIRNSFYYINGSSMLWYIKKELPGSKNIINRSSLTLIYGIMHWLSELVRYNPSAYTSLLKSSQNWLVKEFLEIGLDQFIDEISSEISGVNILCTGIRK